MRDEIEHPVRGHQASDEQRVPAIALDRKINETQKCSPSQLCDKAVGNWVRGEIERRGREKAGHYAYVFNTKEQQDRPQHIRELRGKHQCAQGSIRGRFFRGKCYSKMAEEHAASLFFDSLQIARSVWAKNMLAMFPGNAILLNGVLQAARRGGEIGFPGWRACAAAL